jgi:hypothetical protein
LTCQLLQLAYTPLFQFRLRVSFYPFFILVYVLPPLGALSAILSYSTPPFWLGQENETSRCPSTERTRRDKTVRKKKAMLHYLSLLYGSSLLCRLYWNRGSIHKSNYFKELFLTFLQICPGTLLEVDAYLN